MEVLTSLQHRALAFIAAANLGGYAPQIREVEVWLNDPVPADMSTIMDSIRGGYWYARTLESPVEHLETLEWIRVSRSGGVELTELGHALLRSADAEEQEQHQVVVLDSESPLAYASLIGELSDIGNALLIDPYLELEHLLDLENYTQIRRVLISTRHSESSRGRSMALFTEKRDDSGPEIRVANELHDRVIVAEDGRVWTLGMSLNGVSRRKSITVLTPLPEPAAKALANWSQGIWESASPLIEDEPEPIVTGSEKPKPDHDN